MAKWSSKELTSFYLLGGLYSAWCPTVMRPSCSSTSSFLSPRASFKQLPGWLYTSRQEAADRGPPPFLACCGQTLQNLAVDLGRAREYCKQFKLATAMLRTLRVTFWLCLNLGSASMNPRATRIAKQWAFPFEFDRKRPCQDRKETIGMSETKAMTWHSSKHRVFQNM